MNARFNMPGLMSKAIDVANKKSDVFKKCL